MGHCVQNFLIAPKASFTMDRNKYWLIGLLIITSSSVEKGCLLIQSSFLYWQRSMQNWSTLIVTAAVAFVALCCLWIQSIFSLLLVQVNRRSSVSRVFSCSQAQWNLITKIQACVSWDMRDCDCTIDAGAKPGGCCWLSIPPRAACHGPLVLVWILLVWFTRGLWTTAVYTLKLSD